MLDCCSIAHYMYYVYIQIGWTFMQFNFANVPWQHWYHVDSTNSILNSFSRSLVKYSAFFLLLWVSSEFAVNFISKLKCIRANESRRVSWSWMWMKICCVLRVETSLAFGQFEWHFKWKDIVYSLLSTSPSCSSLLSIHPEKCNQVEESIHHHSVDFKSIISQHLICACSLDVGFRPNVLNTTNTS